MIKYRMSMFIVVIGKLTLLFTKNKSCYYTDVFKYEL